jgi:vitamin B12 transporter
VRLGGYALVNLRAQYDFAKNWFLRTRIGNFFDREYETIDTYNSLGRNYFVTLGYQSN